MPAFWSSLRFVAALLCALLLSPRLRAGDAVSWAGLVPADVETLVIVEDAAGWRAGPAAGLEPLLAGARVDSSELTKAWRGLAGALQLDGDRAFDALLGDRFVFAERTPRAPGVAEEWIVLSVVTVETEALIRAKLNVAPRRVASGVSVLSLEDGRFWLATTGLPGAARAIVMLGPSGAPGLFDELIPTIGKPLQRSLLSSKMGEDLRSVLPGAGSLCFLKRRDDEGRLRLVGLAAKRGAASVEFGMMARSQPIAESLADVEVSSRAVIDSLSEGALFAAWEWDVPDLPLLLGIDVPEFDAAAMLGVAQGDRFIGHRSAYIVGDSPAGGLCVAGAFEARDHERLAAEGDRLMATLALSLLGPDPEADASLMDFTGQHPQARREIDLSDSATGIALRPLFKDPRLSWRSLDANAAEDRWWLVGIGVDGVRRLEDSLIESRWREGPETQHWVSVGMARPAAFLRFVQESALPLPPGLAPAVSAASRIESISWWLRRGDGGSLRGGAALQFVGLAGER